MKKPRTTKEFLNLIYTTPPVEVNQSDEGVEIHSLTSKNHLPLYLWAIKSFVWQSGIRPRIVAHEDGTLTKNDEELLVSHLPGIQIIPQQSADSEVLPSLAKHPYSHRYREEQPFARKIFDVFHYAQGERIIIQDSDVLFFDRPSQICDWIDERESSTVLYNYDPFDLDRKKRPIITVGLGVEYPQGYNAGLQCVPRDRLDYRLTEEYFKFLYQENILEWTSEQRCMSIMAANGPHSPLPREEYFFQNRRNVFYQNRGIDTFPDGIKAKHYSRYARNLFASEGINKKYSQITTQGSLG